MTNKSKELYAQGKERFPEIKDIKNDLESLKTNVVGLGKNVQENGADLTAELKEKVQQRISKLQEKGKGELHRMEDRVKDKPAKSMAVAFFAGLVASWLFGGRK
ncbi:MAG: DUF883 family protein [Alphaproteobacteria bacterium]